MRYAFAVIAVALLVAGCSKVGQESDVAQASDDGATAAVLMNNMSTRQIEDLQVWLAERRLERLSPERQDRIEFLLAGEAERQRQRATGAHP